VQLSGRFDAALDLAADLHRTQMRKSSDIPYLAHLLAVAGLVLEHGGTENEAIAGLLHDAVEDQGGAPVLPGPVRRVSPAPGWTTGRGPLPDGGRSRVAHGLAADRVMDG
jgi:hypothetical protein